MPKRTPLPSFSRREFLKLSALLPAGAALAPLVSRLLPSQPAAPGLPANVILILFDAMSARNLSLYGYPRDTTPNFIRFASRANVYHSHYSAGNFTIPGTASLLSGLYPWTHRAINEAGMMRRNLTDQNIFRLMQGQYKRLAFGQNIWANFILNQFQNDIDIRLSPASFSLANGIAGSWFKNDMTPAYRTFDDFLFRFSSSPASLIFGSLERLNYTRNLVVLDNSLSKEYPRGAPRTVDYSIYFRLEDLADGIISTSRNFSAPTFAYFHLWPPHAHYKPNQDFYLKFVDHYQPVVKPEHRLGEGQPQNFVNGQRRLYDEYVANIDFEFGRVLDALEQSGVLDKSVVVVTADHGEMFERGVYGHVTPLMYDPVLRIPLLISTPGQSARIDIQDPTNSVDVLPTLLHLSGRPAPAWCEGSLLPGLGGQYDPLRSSFSVEAKHNPAYAPLTTATLVMRKGPYKLIQYLGYEGAYQDAFELYDLENDLEEMNDLYASQPALAAPLQDELLARLAESNSHFPA